jgi:hypothetical protein
MFKVLLVKGTANLHVLIKLLYAIFTCNNIQLYGILVIFDVTFATAQQIAKYSFLHSIIKGFITYCRHNFRINYMRDIYKYVTEVASHKNTSNTRQTISHKTKLPTLINMLHLISFLYWRPSFNFLCPINEGFSVDILK